MLRELPLSYYGLEDESDFARWLDECATQPEVCVCEICTRHEKTEAPHYDEAA